MTDTGVGKGEGGLPKAIIAFIVVAVIAVAIAVVFSRKRSYEPVGAGTDAINFTLPDLDGKNVSLADYRGKVVFLNFWATWCKPCEDEIPSIEALHRLVQGQQFVILAVSVDHEGPDTVRRYAEKYGITFKVLHDRNGAVKEEYKTTGVPETFVIDQNGVIAEKIWGPRDWSRRGSLTMIMELLNNGPKPKDSYKADKLAERR